jgi:hypothetical protein
MCNCNQKRMMYSSVNLDQHKGLVKVKLISQTHLVLNGRVTGRMYIFRNFNDITWVDKRDLQFMKNIREIEILS